MPLFILLWFEKLARKACLSRRVSRGVVSLGCCLEPYVQLFWGFAGVSLAFRQTRVPVRSQEKRGALASSQGACVGLRYRAAAYRLQNHQSRAPHTDRQRESRASQEAARRPGRREHVRRAARGRYAGDRPAPGAGARAAAACAAAVGGRPAPPRPTVQPHRPGPPPPPFPVPPAAPGGGRSANRSSSAPNGWTPARRRAGRGSKKKPPKTPARQDSGGEGAPAPAAPKESAAHGPAAAGCGARARVERDGQTAGAKALAADAPEDAAGGSLARDRRRCG